MSSATSERRVILECPLVPITPEWSEYCDAFLQMVGEGHQATLELDGALRALRLHVAGIEGSACFVPDPTSRWGFGHAAWLLLGAGQNPRLEPLVESARGRRWFLRAVVVVDDAVLGSMAVIAAHAAMIDDLEVRTLWEIAERLAGDAREVSG